MTDFAWFGLSLASVIVVGSFIVWVYDKATEGKK